MTSQAYHITISYSPSQIIEPCVDCLDKSIFKHKIDSRAITTKLNEKIIPYYNNEKDIKITENIQRKASFDEIWEEITNKHYQIKEMSQ